MKQLLNDADLTFQLSLDHFLQEQEEFSFETVDDYQAALDRLDEVKRVRSSKQRYAIACEVVQKCPQCIEAHLALSLYATELDEQLSALQQASSLSAISLGQDYFSKDNQDYYIDQKTHLFFRSKTAYAVALFDYGFIRKARPHMEMIKRLNPSDTFHITHYLLCVYLLLEDLESGYSLLQQCPEHEAFTVYSKALYAYKNMDFYEAKKWIQSGKVMDIAIYDILIQEPLPILFDEKTKAGYFFMIYEKAIRSWKDFSLFVKSI